MIYRPPLVIFTHLSFGSCCTHNGIVEQVSSTVERHSFSRVILTELLLITGYFKVAVHLIYYSSFYNYPDNAELIRRSRTIRRYRDLAKCTVLVSHVPYHGSGQWQLHNWLGRLVPEARGHLAGHWAVAADN
jgi:hypothetical protein